MANKSISEQIESWVMHRIKTDVWNADCDRLLDNDIECYKTQRVEIIAQHDKDISTLADSISQYQNLKAIKDVMKEAIA